MDYDALLKREWVPRTRKIEAPDELQGTDDADYHVVRQPTANEIAIAREAQEQRNRWTAVAESLRRADPKEIKEIMGAATGSDGDIRPDIGRRVSLLVSCTVEPEIFTESHAVMLIEHHPAFFYQLTDAIIVLAGMGSEAKKKPKTSTETH